MWEGTDLFETSTSPVVDLGYTVDPNTGDVIGVGAGVPSSVSIDKWLGGLKDLGGKAIDAYKSYVGLEQQRSNIDAARQASAAANRNAAANLKLQSDLLGFGNAAERARAQASAARAQGDAAAAIGGGLPIGLVLLVAGGFLLLRR